jgi:hypothetical protein
MQVMSKSSSPPRRLTKDVVVPYVLHGKQEHVTVDVPDAGETADDGGGHAESARETSRETAREAVQEAAHYVQTLADNGQLDGPDATHEIVSTPDGTRRLIRRRFSGR